jgi:hypothetical protein
MRTVVLEPDVLQEVAPEQTDVRARHVHYRWHCNDVRGELECLFDPIVIATDDGDPEPIDRTVEIAGDTADGLVTELAPRRETEVQLPRRS